MIELLEVRKVAVVAWDAEAVKGKQVSMQVAGQEKRTVDNDGEANLFFPLDYSGEVVVTIQGSKSGEESGSIQVS